MPTTGFAAPDAPMPKQPKQPKLQPRNTLVSLSKDDGLNTMSTAELGDFFFKRGSKFDLPPPQIPVETQIENQAPEATAKGVSDTSSSERDILSGYERDSDLIVDFQSRTAKEKQAGINDQVTASTESADRGWNARYEEHMNVINHLKFAHQMQFYRSGESSRAAAPKITLRITREQSQVGPNHTKSKEPAAAPHAKTMPIPVYPERLKNYQMWQNVWGVLITTR
jgi:hypothetical protein